MNDNRNKVVVLCDLGGVLIDLNWISSAQALFGRDLSRDELLEKWLSLESIKRFEAGLCDFSEFYRNFNNENPTSLSEAEFYQQFLSIIGAVKSGCLEILCQLKQTFKLALLSNTNALHIEHLRRQTGLLDYFDRLFLSYEMHLVKPEPKIFATVAQQLECKPEEIYFFDDSPTNVKAAGQSGLKAFQVTDPSAILTTMQKIFGK